MVCEQKLLTEEKYCPEGFIATGLFLIGPDFFFLSIKL